MQILNLDYQIHPNQPRKLAGWLLLLTGTVLSIEMVVSYDRLQSELDTMNNEIRISNLQLNMSRKESVSRQFTENDFGEARKIVRRLATPWDALFAGLESVRNENVAILSIEPDMQTGLMQIEGEAKDFAAVLILVSQLRKTKPFSDVFMSYHGVTRDDPLHPVSFILSMRWMKPL